MNSRFWMLLATTVVLGAACGALAQAPAIAGNGPQFTSANELVRPANVNPSSYPTLLDAARRMGPLNPSFEGSSSSRR